MPHPALPSLVARCPTPPDVSIFGEKIDTSRGRVYSFDMSDVSSSDPARIFDPAAPYNDLPPLPPAQELETARVLKAVIEARSELAALNTACRLIPNPEIITSTIPLREAQASTEIENIVTTNDELFRAEWSVDLEPSPATKEALRYRDALRQGVEMLMHRPVSEKVAVEICSTLQGGHAALRSTPGTYIGDPHRNTRIYTPPEGLEVIQRHLSAWERFLYSDHGLDPLVLMAAAHYQFEAIHPFYDGNGRTGRILNILLLLQEEVLSLPVLYLSGYIVDNKDEYYRLLNAVTAHGEWEDWVLFMVRAVATSARSTSLLIDDLRHLQDTTTQRVRELGIAPAAELTELLFIQPYVRISDVIDRGLAKRQTASGWLAALVEAHILDEWRVGRSKVFLNTAALEILTRR